MGVRFRQYRRQQIIDEFETPYRLAERIIELEQQLSPPVEDTPKASSATMSDGLVNNSRETWLHGWPRMGTGVLIGTGIHCVGCGKDHGITCVAFDESWEHWVKDRPYPDWPFDEGNCPICYLEKLHSECRNQHYRVDTGEEIASPAYVQVGKDGMPIRDLRGKLPT